MWILDRVSKIFISGEHSLPVIYYGAGYKNWIPYTDFTGVWCQGTGETGIVPADVH